MEIPTRAPNAAPAQPARVAKAPLLAVALAEVLAVLDADFDVLLAEVVLAATEVALTETDAVWLARGAVDCPEIWERTSAEKTPVMLSRL